MIKGSAHTITLKLLCFAPTVAGFLRSIPLFTGTSPAITASPRASSAPASSAPASSPRASSPRASLGFRASYIAPPPLGVTGVEKYRPLSKALSTRKGRKL